MAYVCKYCTYSDLVTDRFTAHVLGQHGGRAINADEFFRKVAPFQELQQCPWEACEFRSHTLTRLNHHLTLHSIQAAREASVVRVEDLSTDLQADLVVSQRRDMGAHSERRKLEERRQGLPSPPLVLNLELGKPVHTVRPKRVGEQRPTPPRGVQSDDERRWESGRARGRGA